MNKNCDYCNTQYDDSLDKCPHCGAPNSIVKRGEGVPKTIEELRQWYNYIGLPPDNITRFFIGKNIKEPKNFGIYKESSTGDIIVYKNKANGQRVIRYRGKDEAYAVNEFYLRLKEEMLNQQQLNANKEVNQQNKNKKETILDDITIQRKAGTKWSPREIRAGIRLTIAIIAISIGITMCNPLWVAIDTANTAIEQVCDNIKIRLHGNEYKNTDGTYDWDTYYHDERIKEYEREESGWDSPWSGDSWDAGGTDWDSDW